MLVVPVSCASPEQAPPEQASLQEYSSLREVARDRAGDFELQSVEQSEGNPSFEGSRDYLHARYAKPGGEDLSLDLISMPSPEEADKARREAVRLSQLLDLKPVDERPIEIGGERAGTVSILKRADEEHPSYVSWSNGDVYAVVMADGNVALPFFEASLYGGSPKAKRLEFRQE